MSVSGSTAKLASFLWLGDFKSTLKEHHENLIKSFVQLGVPLCLCNCVLPLWQPCLREPNRILHWPKIGVRSCDAVVIQADPMRSFAKVTLLLFGDDVMWCHSELFATPPVVVYLKKPEKSWYKTNPCIIQHVFFTIHTHVVEQNSFSTKLWDPTRFAFQSSLPNRHHLRRSRCIPSLQLTEESQPWGPTQLCVSALQTLQRSTSAFLTGCFSYRKEKVRPQGKTWGRECFCDDDDDDDDDHDDDDDDDDHDHDDDDDDDHDHDDDDDDE